jgi:hypothetical protein
MKGNLLRGFGAFIAVLLFGCAVYFIAICPKRFSGDGIRRDDASDSGGSFAEETADQQSGNDFSSASSSADAPMEREEMQPTVQANRTQDEQNANSQATLRDGALQTNLNPGREPIFQQPVAFAEASPDPEASAEEIAEINALRQEFIEEIGGYDQDPSDPEYRKRWQVAQQFLDEQLRTELGEEVFNRLQNERANSQPSEE